MVLRVGIAGLGIAMRQILPGFDVVEGTRLAAVADVRAEEVANFKRQYPEVETFTSVNEMCRHAQIDAVWVATPNHLHAEHTMIAAENGKHVICEKPMAVNLAEADRMIEAIERNGVRYVQGHSKIFRHPIRKMGEVIRSGRLGRVIQINTSMYNDWLRRPVTASEVDERHGGGVVYRQGPHQMDIVRYLGGGMVRSVRATTGRCWNPPYDIEGNYSAFLDFENGATALVSFNGYGHLDVAELTWNIGEGGQLRSEQQLWGPRPPPTGVLTLEQKYALPQYSAKALAKSRFEKRDAQDFFGLTIVSCEHGDIRQSPHGLYVYTEKGREEIGISQKVRSGELQELVDAVTQARPSFPDARWGKASLETIMAIFQSSRERREIMLSSQVPVPEFA